MLRSAGMVSVICLWLTGCVNPLTRAQMAEEAEKDRDLALPLVQDVADVANIAPIQVHGVALVTGLEGTGHCPAGPYRTILEQYLLKHSGPKGGEITSESYKTKIRHILDNPNNALVIVSGFIPAGVRKADRFDVEVKLPHGSQAASLAGGFLELCLMRVYEAKGNLSERHAGSSEWLQGHILAHAKGPLVVGFGGNSDSHELKRARVWQGGVSRIDRPYVLMMKNDDKSIRITNLLAERLNLLYRDDPHSRAQYGDQQRRILLLGDVASQLNQKHDPSGINQGEMARAANKELINVKVPFTYRHNHERFLRVACKTPVRETDPGLPRYRKRLEKMLLDPRDTLKAAMHLEALGRDSVPTLKAGLEHEHPFVRFACAETLAYLGSTLGVETLAQLAPEYPLLSKNCTLALANLGENVCRHKLADLLISTDPALRCAAFHALSLIDESDPRLGGIFLNDTFWLYRQPQAPGAMVYYSSSKRPQVVLFGRNIVLSPNTRMIVGKDFTVTMNEAENKCVAKRITAQSQQSRVTSPRLDDVLTALSELGATYPDLVDFLRRAGEFQYVSCPVVNWITPNVGIDTLVEEGRNLR